MKLFGLFNVKARCFEGVMEQKREIFDGKDEYFLRNGAVLLENQHISYPPNLNVKDQMNLKDLLCTRYQRSHNQLRCRSIAKIYKETLGDQTVAIKVPEGLDPTDEAREFFFDQVTTKLQISHKNAVKLLGCCLETRVPILVYYFIQMVPSSNISMVKIATEISYTLSYSLRCIKDNSS